MKSGFLRSASLLQCENNSFHFKLINTLYLLLFVFSANSAVAQTNSDVWINEIHYDNVGGDVGEFVEIVVQANLANQNDITLTLYNGSSAGSLGSYASFPFSEFTKGDTEGSVTIYYLDLPANGIQNGAPDGLSLDVGGQLIQFLSYEGTFTASDGPAQGVLSTDIGVEQAGAAAGSSVSLVGTGGGYDDFFWIVTETNSKGSSNLDQTIEATASEIDEPTIQVFASGVEISNGSLVTFNSTFVGNSNEISIEIKNLGNDTLNISEVTVSGDEFSTASALNNSALAFNEIGELVISFSPESPGEFLQQNGLTITSNSVNAASFAVSLEGEGIDGSGSIPIAQARTLSLGTRITITGRVSVGNEFGGPLYMQDETAGLAVFWEPLQAVAEIGDSITVTGPLNVFKGGVQGPDSDFLLQISARDDDNNIFFEVHETENEAPIPVPVSINQINTGEFESQLVVVQNTTIDHTGAFQANTNYEITDGTGAAEMRIDNTTNIVGVEAPTEPTNIVGVVGKFAGVNQLLPRTADDLGAEEITLPGDDISKDVTFDIVTWNVEWFGSTANGPTDEQTQFDNVVNVIKTIDADVYALQEISDPTVFSNLVTALEEYDGLIADFSQPQKTAYLYKKSTIQLRGSRLITTGMLAADWANGRFPFEFHFNATINEEIREIYTYNIHAKAFGEPSDYSQRVDASGQIKRYLDDNRADKNVFLLGDFNDEIVTSTSGEGVSPYKNFDDDTEYTIVTKSLEQAGFTSYSSSSMIDHIVFSSELSDEYFEGTERIENPFYIGNYLSQTSDHYPVWVRFEWGEPVSNESEFTLPSVISLEQNYPNPFNPSTNINYSLNETGAVSLEVYDIMGRKVATLLSGEVKAAGTHTVSFDASSLASGMYVYRLTNGTLTISKTMMLLK